MRWPSGPLEIARRERTGSLNPAVRQTLEYWHQPAALELLKDSPLDCIVITWAAGLPADAEQWRTAAPLIDAAHRRNLAVVGWVDDPADPQAALAAARSSGLSAVAIRNFKGNSDLPVVAWSEREDVPWDSAAPVVAIAGNVWPAVNIASGGAAPAAGPTSLPWLDSNGWYIQMARERLKAPLWVVFDPGGKGTVFSARSYVNAICDSEAAGGRWLISLDDDLRAGLGSAGPAALETWKQITNSAGFFQEHADWRSYRSLGLVGVISDFRGADFELSGELLNLMARRDLLFRTIWKEQAAQRPFAGLKALVYLDTAAPDPALRRKITEFVEQGGLLIAGPGWAASGKPAGSPGLQTQFDVRSLGKGRLAVAREAITDPYQVAVDTQYLLSHRNDLVKIYNSASSGCTRFTASADSKNAVLQCLSYADGGRGGQSLRTVWVALKYRKTRLWTIGAQPQPLDPESAEEYVGVEYHLPASTQQSYLALEFEA
jgi:hypothetical protein